jgi:threonine dehydrogenase-like Zn-dependent dehydrogenase
MTKELISNSLEHAEFRNYELPELGANDLQVRAQFGAMKHGTEMASLGGYAAARGEFDSELELFVKSVDGVSDSEPRPIGNMVVGTVIAVGSEVSEFNVGDSITAHAPLREEQVVSASRCWRIPEGVSWKSAVCLDPAQFAVGAVRDGNVRVGDAVAVFGLGAIGLMAVQVAKAAGVNSVFAIDPAQNRREVAKAYGADEVLDPTSSDVGLELKQLTGSRGVDVVIEYSGATSAMQAALRGIAFGGNVVAGAFPPPYGAGLDFGAEAHLNRPNIVFSRAVSDPSRDHPRWDQRRIFETCLQMFERGQLNGDLVVDPVVPFDQLDTELPKVLASPGNGIKLGCTFD